MGSPSPFSYLAAILALNSLFFVALALLPGYKPFKERLAIWALGLTALGAFFGFIDQAWSYLGEEGHEQWPIALSAVFTPVLVVGTMLLLRRARKRAESTAAQQEHGNASKDINN